MAKRTLRSLVSTLFLACLASPQCAPRNQAPAAVAGAGRVGDRAHVPFDDDWRFFKGDGSGFERPGLDDSAWRTLDLPHDWAIEGTFALENNPHTGGLDVTGVGWYRKHFRVPEAGRGRRYGVEFDGAMANARVFLNGQELGDRPYGYIGFGFDLTPDLAYGGADNVLAVRLAPEPEASRWYPGAGIYRHVWLDATSDVHVTKGGAFVTTPTIAPDRAVVVVRTELQNHRASGVDVTLETSVVDAEGRVVAGVDHSRHLGAQSKDVDDAQIDLPSPRRWDIDDPYLYSVRSVVRKGTRILDRLVTPFGVRSLAFDLKSGFALNGRPMKLQGVCMHHDLGALGTAVNARAIERQLRLLKAMGANAIRTSHNPPAPELLEECDRLGLLVMDEAFDMWRKPKVANGHGKYFDTWAETDLRDMIRRDRNHPSVILYSIGNEVLEQTDPEGGKIAAHLTAICHEEDRTRPVTAAFNRADEAIQNGLAGAVDIPGFNYQALEYERILREHPDWIIIGSETSSTVSSRGVYHLPLEKYDRDPSHQILRATTSSAPFGPTRLTSSSTCKRAIRASSVSSSGPASTI